MPDLQAAETPKKRVIMTDAEMRILESMGWDFVPRGAEWDWIKFDSAGKPIAYGGDQTWGMDYDEVSRQATAACFD